MEGVNQESCPPLRENSIFDRGFGPKYTNADWMPLNDSAFRLAFVQIPLTQRKHFSFHAKIHKYILFMFKY
jgi:hypothetical protein